MIPTDCAERRDAAAAEFDAMQNRSDGLKVVNSLSYGLTTLRNLLFTRVHEDVMKYVGRDSLVMPLSPQESEDKTKLEIEIFQVAVSSAAVKSQHYANHAERYAEWLTRLRLGDCAADEAHQQRLTHYLTIEAEGRRVGFSRVLETTFPQATRAPLVLYRLFPPAVGIVTAVAFGDRDRAISVRQRQASWLPAINDCHECRGRPLDNGEHCPVCENPLWGYDWLTAAD